MEKPNVTAVAEQTLEAGHVVRGRDQQDIADAGEHEHAISG